MSSKNEVNRRSTEYIESTQTLIGTNKKDLMDMETGEHIVVDQIIKRAYGSKQFWKMYLMDFLMILGVIDSKQVDIFIYIVENTNPSTNLFIGTYKKIAKDAHTSEATIARTMKKLTENNFIKKVQNGLWFVNPNILMKGNDTKRQILLSYYVNDTPIDSITYNRTKREPFDNVTDEMNMQSDNPLAIEEKDNA